MMWSHYVLKARSYVNFFGSSAPSRPFVIDVMRAGITTKSIASQILFSKRTLHHQKLIVAHDIHAAYFICRITLSVYEHENVEAVKLLELTTINV